MISPVLRSFQDWYLRYWLRAVEGVAGKSPASAALSGIPSQSGSHQGLSLSPVHSSIVETIRQSNNDVGWSCVEFSGIGVRRARARLHQEAEDIEKIAVAVNENGTPILLRDVATVRLGPDMRRGLAELDGQGEVAGGIVVMRFGENALNVIERSKRS